MANEISKINNFVLDLFSEDSLVNTLSIVPTLTVDLNKENIYPLVNVDMTNLEIEEQVITVFFTMTIITQRDIRPVKTDSKLLSSDNYIDNINETHSIAQRFINFLLTQNNDELIEIDTMSNLTILKQWRAGNCDGVQFTIQLTIPNRGESC